MSDPVTEAAAKFSRPVPFIQDEQLANWFTHHPPTGGQVEAHQAIRAAGLAFAKVIRDSTPSSADQTAAIRKVREAVATANMAIACGGK